jgi:hypothetical protein
MFPVEFKRSDRWGEYSLLIKREFRRKNRDGHNIIWLEVRCGCGNVYETYRKHVLSGRSSSCGCRSRRISGEVNTTHGESAGKARTKEMETYKHMRRRCLNKKDKNFHHYGGRGIEFRFDSFQHFLSSVGRAPSPKHSIDRIDNNGHYEPGNVRWATSYQQGLNRRNNRRITLDGVTKTLEEWCNDLNFKRGRFYYFSGKGLSDTEVLQMHQEAKGDE